MQLTANCIPPCSPRLLSTLPGDCWPYQEVYLLPGTPLKLPSARTSLLLCWLAWLQTSQSKSPVGFDFTYIDTYVVVLS